MIVDSGKTFSSFLFFSSLTGRIMNIHITMVPLVSLLAGILILVMPRLLNFIIAIYLIAIGVIGLFGGSHFHMY